MLLLCAAALLWQCHKNDLKRSEQIAGTYAGTFASTSFDGQTYPVSYATGEIELLALGDTLLLNSSTGYLNVPDKFLFDFEASDASSHWHGLGQQYDQLTYYPAQDSLIVSTPSHSSVGWLGRSFYGRRK